MTLGDCLDSPSKICHPFTFCGFMLVLYDLSGDTSYTSCPAGLSRFFTCELLTRLLISFLGGKRLGSDFLVKKFVWFAWGKASPGSRNFNFDFFSSPVTLESFPFFKVFLLDFISSSHYWSRSLANPSSCCCLIASIFLFLRSTISSFRLDVSTRLLEEACLNSASEIRGASEFEFSWMGAKNLGSGFADVDGPDVTPLRDFVGLGGISRVTFGFRLSRSVNSELGSVFNLR